MSADVVEADDHQRDLLFFPRQRLPFDHLRETIIPELLKVRAGKRSLRIWCAALLDRTGGRISIAMCLKELGAQTFRVGGSKIIATDLRARRAGKI